MPVISTLLPASSDSTGSSASCEFSRDPARESLVRIGSVKIEESVSPSAAMGRDHLPFNSNKFADVFCGLNVWHNYGRIATGELSPAKKIKRVTATILILIVV